VIDLAAGMGDDAGSGADASADRENDMRRLWGSVLLGFGVFLVVAAGMLRFYVFDQLLITPKDQYAQTVAPGSGTYFDPGTLTEKPADLVARRTVKGDVGASNDTTGVWDVSVVIQTADGTFVRASLDRVAFDRRSGDSVHCCAEAVDSEPVQHQGLSYKFPFNTQQQTYQFWDVNSRAAHPARFVGEEELQGLTTYKFSQEIPSQELRTQEVPGTLVGEPTPTFNAPVWYQNVRTVWVEPTTGIIIKGSEQTKTTLRNSVGQDRVVVLESTFIFDEPTQRSQAELARDSLDNIRLVKWIIPGAALLVGLLSIAFGALLLRGRRTPPESPAPAPAEAE
jgi:hypothetical protein